MKEERYFYVPQPQTGELPADEAAHACRVLRLKTGDHMHLIDGQGTFHEAQVTLATQRRCAYRIISSTPQTRQWPAHLTLAMAPTKMLERTETAAEKLTEIGIDTLAYLECRFSERRALRTDRIERVVVSAVKQSRKAWKPDVLPLTPFEHFVKQPREGLKFICHCYDEIPRSDIYDVIKANEQQAVTILIGPEGDFSTSEVRLAMACGYQPISLGTSRLRTETAAIVAAVAAHLAMK